MSYAGTALLGNLLGTDQLLGKRLMGLTAFAIVPNVFFVVALCLLPETPKFLLVARKKKDEAAVSTLNELV